MPSCVTVDAYLWWSTIGSMIRTPPRSKSTLKYRQSKITLDMYYLVTSALKLTPYILESRVVFYFITLMGFVKIILPEDELRLLNIITYRNHYLWHNNVVILFLNICVYLLWLTLSHMEGHHFWTWLALWFHHRYFTPPWVYTSCIKFTNF